jgi:hypothetical protein
VDELMHAIEILSTRGAKVIQYNSTLALFTFIQYSADMIGLEIPVFHRDIVVQHLCNLNGIQGMILFS